MPGEAPAPKCTSRYVTMRDGVRIAIDVWLPADFFLGDRLPTLMRATRYWREQTERRLDEARRFTAVGYALVIVDVRGSGASFGSWTRRSVDELEDLGEIVDWIIAQPWSNGRVGTNGVSYDANTADAAVSTGRAAIVAAAPRFSDFDAYAHLLYPGGIAHDWFIDAWGATQMVRDRNDIDAVPDLTAPQRCDLARMIADGPKPVDDDADRGMLAEAIAQRTLDRDLYGRSRITFRDDRYSTLLPSLDSTSAFCLRDQIERNGAAYFAWGSWFDAGTASGALSRFMTFSNPQRVIIGAWSHGASAPALPFAPSERVEPDVATQYRDIIEFFDRHLKDSSPAAPERTVRYYTVNDGWHETNQWPPPGTTHQPWFLGANAALLPRQPDAAEGADSYTVDFTATTGTTNRWHTQSGDNQVRYTDRAIEDLKLLTYTSAPLRADMEISGHPVVTLFITSTMTDGAFHVYLETINAEGTVLPIAEGQLRALHRRVSVGPPPYECFGPYHTFRRVDAMPLIPGEVAEITFALLPIAILVKRGTRLRVAIAGHDADTFTRIPASGTPTVTVLRGREHRSRIEIPIRLRVATP